MQTLIFRLTLIVLISFCASNIWAATQQHSIQVNWTYTPPEDLTVTAFNLHHEGEKVCETQDPDSEGMNCMLFLESGSTTFTLSAELNDGSESPHSAPFSLTVQETQTSRLRTAIVGLQVLTGHDVDTGGTRLGLPQVISALNENAVQQ